MWKQGRVLDEKECDEELGEALMEVLERIELHEGYDFSGGKKLCTKDGSRGVDLRSKTFRHSSVGYFYISKEPVLILDAETWEVIDDENSN
ncbi:hypothetical protein [Flavobacterium alkalisoli]|uniref:hypothetical protein n=1 Tax=Flavobacterium alkalisoli TaxID=2602769 RepID=UPI003A8D0B01